MPEHRDEVPAVLWRAANEVAEEVVWVRSGRLHHEEPIANSRVCLRENFLEVRGIGRFADQHGGRGERAQASR